MPRRGEHIHKRTVDNRWEGRYKAGVTSCGKTKYKSVYGRTYKEVKAKLVAKEKEVQESSTLQTDPLAKDPLFGEVLQMWLLSNRIRLKGATEQKYTNIIETHINPELGGFQISQITSAQINLFLEKKLQSGRMDGKGGLSASYVRSIMLIIHSALEYARQEGFYHALRTPIHKPVIEKKEVSVLSKLEREILEKNLLVRTNETKIGILISLYTGLRIGEVCALAWEDINFTEKILHVRHTIARVKTLPEEEGNSKLILDTPKTKTSLRDIPVSSFLFPILVSAKEKAVSPFVVSTTETFISLRTYEYRYHKVLKECNLPSINYHVLRHSFATRCIEAGVDVKTLSELLGHADVSITLNTYVHSSMELKRVQLEKLTE